MGDLFWRVLIFDFLAAFVLAKLEIQVEGKFGWAEHLPTTRVNNKLVQRIFAVGHGPFTYYHLWLFIANLTLIHLPFFVFPNFWSLSNELFMIGNFILGIGLEDFFWFIFNPNFGFKKLNKQHAPWHSWVGPIPTLYIRIFIFSSLLLWVSWLIQARH